jgi:hypothetical protein
MNLNTILPFIVVGLVLVLVVGPFLFRIYKNGLKGAMFGAPLGQTVGEVSGSGNSIMSFTLRVYVLGGDSPEKAVGLEIVAKSVASYQMMPISLSTENVRKLIMFLESATRSK